MRFKIDENLPVEVAEAFRTEGFDAATVIEQRLSGESDETVATVCAQEERVLLTLDVGFSDLRAYPPQDYAGLLVLRLRRQDKPYLIQIVNRLIPLLTSDIRGQLWFIEENKVRIRTS